jgi:hypothetical protein
MFYQTASDSVQGNALVLTIPVAEDDSASAKWPFDFHDLDLWIPGLRSETWGTPAIAAATQ